MSAKRTGALDTENGQIDYRKCIEGCRACVYACISNAISLVPETFPQQNEKHAAVKKAILALVSSKVKQETASAELAKTKKTAEARKLAKAMEISNKMMAEDLYREIGYMVPQNIDTKELLKKLFDNPAEDFPTEKAEELLELLSRRKLR